MCYDMRLISLTIVGNIKLGDRHVLFFFMTIFNNGYSSSLHVHQFIRFFFQDGSVFVWKMLQHVGLLLIYVLKHHQY